MSTLRRVQWQHCLKGVGLTLLTLVGTVALPDVARARLGETEAELVDRFGPVRQRDDRFGFVGFIKGEYLICFQILDGKSEYMIFGYVEPYTALHESQVRHLLDLNSAGGDWREVSSSEAEVHFETLGGSRYAIWEKIPKTTKRPNLTIMTPKGKRWLKEYQKRYVENGFSGF